MTAARDRVERERQFHDALIREGHTTIATKEWWETPGGRVRFERRIALLKAVCTSLKAAIERARVLVIGCGDGEWVNRISEFADVTGIDLSPLIVAQASSRLKDTAHARVEVGDVHELRFAMNTFDVCFANSVLHHLDLPIALPEVRRVLRPGGKLVEAEPNRSNPQVRWMYRSTKNRSRYGLTPDEEAFSRKSINVILRQHFEDVSVSHFDFWHPLLGHKSDTSLLFRSVLALERLPLIKRISGSLWITAERGLS
jgi:SAM-dependent methyltransferase